MPGGAPLRSASSKRPCKYGARDSDGRCPKKSSAASARASAPSGARSKPPCKYGPRDQNGLCPKKPKTPRAAKAPTVRQVKSVDAAASQAGEVLRSSKATRSQKKEAVKVLGSAVAGEATKKVAQHVAREVKKAATSKSGKAAVKSALTKAAKVAGVVPTVAGIGATLYVGGKVLKANRSRECKAWAKEQLRLTEQRLGAGAKQLTAEHRATLLAQYEDHCNKKPVTNPFVGK